MSDLRGDVDALVDAHLADDGLVAADLSAAQSTIVGQDVTITALAAENAKLQAQIDNGPVGAGVIRPWPTQEVLPGDTSLGTWKGDVLSVKASIDDCRDVIIRGFVARSRDAGYGLVNVLIEPTPAQVAALTAARWLHSAGGSYATQGEAAYVTMRSSAPSQWVNGIGGRNMHYYAPDIHHVTDGISPIGSATSGDVNMLVERPWVHDHLFALSDGHDPTPPKAADGTVITGPYAGKPWNHCDDVQIERDDLTGFTIQDGVLDARWAIDVLSRLPLPNARKELSTLMLNGGRKIKILRMRFNGGEQCVNNNDPLVTGEITDCVFGPDIMRDAKGPLAMVLRAPGLVESGNTMADGSPVTARRLRK